MQLLLLLLTQAYESGPGGPKGGCHSGCERPIGKVKDMTARWVRRV